jgi:triosephosphate isomerase
MVLHVLLHSHNDRAVLAAGLVAVLCIGETLEERQQGITEAVCAVQLSKALQGVVLPNAATVSTVLYFQFVLRCECSEVQSS